jgi:predicted TIM-barrel fold metal-dependent hydrolase
MEDFMDPLLIVSGDGHLGAEPETYRPYFDPQHRDLIADLEKDNKWFTDISNSIRPPLADDMMEAVDPDRRMRAGGTRGAWDIKLRMEELDREGVAAEIVYPGVQLAIQPFFSVVNNPWPAEIRAAGMRAYHRWAAECFDQSGGRMHGVADPGPCLDMAETVKELRWCAAHGFRSVQAPGSTADTALPPITDRYYDPFWATCAELGLVVTAHAGYGHLQGKFWEFAEVFLKQTVGAHDENIRLPMNAMEALETEGGFFHLDMAPRRLVWRLMLGGVFDRHPALKLTLTEVRADWVPPTLRRLDELAARQSTPLKRTPSEYWASNCFVTPSSIHRCEVEMRHEIGVDTLMFGTDYPHPESTWPNTRQWIQMTFPGVPEVEARKILGENAIRCYGLDRDKIAATAARIAPKPREVFVDRPSVHPLAVKNFGDRGGILNPPEVVRNEDIDPLFSEDLRQVHEAA